MPLIEIACLMTSNSFKARELPNINFHGRRHLLPFSSCFLLSLHIQLLSAGQLSNSCIACHVSLLPQASRLDSHACSPQRVRCICQAAFGTFDRSFRSLTFLLIRHKKVLNNFSMARYERFLLSYRESLTLFAKMCSFSRIRVI